MLTSTLCSTSSPLLALEDGLLEELGLLLEPAALERESGLLLELALDVGRLPPSLPSEIGEDELEPKCCCRCGLKIVFKNYLETDRNFATSTSV